MTSQEDTIRVFIALDIPVEAKQRLSTAVKELQQAIPSGVRWVNPQGIHLTLKFLGNIDPGLAEGLQEAMASSTKESNPFDLQLSGLGVFPNQSQPRVLWAGIGGDMDSLGTLQERVDDAVSKLGFAKEKRAYSPHLTLGRVRDGVNSHLRHRIGSTLARTPLEPSDPWQVVEMHLIKTNFGPDGTTYTSMGSQPLRVGHG